MSRKVRDQIETLRAKINKLEEEIDIVAEKAMPEYDDFVHKIGEWSCPTSPLDLCVYNRFEDPAFDGCIFCGEPSERK